MMPIPRFRTLKEGDYISAAEWNALVAFVQAVGKSTMTDGIMDSTGFHPRRKIASVKPSGQTIDVIGPDVYTFVPQLSGTQGQTKFNWYAAKTIEKETFELGESKQEITLKKRGYYEFSTRWRLGLTYLTPGSESPVLFNGNIQWQYEGEWYGNIAQVATDCGLIRINGILYRIGGSPILYGSDRQFLEKGTKIRPACIISSNSNVNGELIPGGCFLNITYLGDITPEEGWQYSTVGIPDF